MARRENPVTDLSDAELWLSLDVNDRALLRAMRGASVVASIVLPSGLRLTGEQAATVIQTVDAVSSEH